MNLLIAVINESYQSFKKNEIAQMYKTKLDMIVER